MIEITVENHKALEKALRKTPEKVNSALARAVNRAVTNVKSNISKQVRENYVIKASDVKKTLEISKATQKQPVAFVRSVGKRIDLTKFRLSPTSPRPKSPPKGGYRVQVRKREGLKTVPRGFLLEARGSIGLFQRTGSERFPIKRLTGPSVPQMIERKDTMEYIESEAKKMLNNRIQHELDRALEEARS